MKEMIYWVMSDDGNTFNSFDTLDEAEGCAERLNDHERYGRNWYVYEERYYGHENQKKR